MANSKVTKSARSDRVDSTSNNLSFALRENRKKTKVLIVTLASHDVIPSWFAEVLLKWGDLEDA
jgi:hypothetical protein